MDPEKKSLNFIFPTKYVIPKSLKFSHWLIEYIYIHCQPQLIYWLENFFQNSERLYQLQLHTRPSTCPHVLPEDSLSDGKWWVFKKKRKNLWLEIQLICTVSNRHLTKNGGLCLQKKAIHLNFIGILNLQSRVNPIFFQRSPSTRSGRSKGLRCS